MVMLGVSWPSLVAGQTKFTAHGISQGSRIPWKQIGYGAIAGGGAFSLAWLTGYGWSMGMGAGAMTTSPEVQRRNAEAYYGEQRRQDVEKAWEEANISRQVDTYYNEWDFNRWLGDYARKEFAKANVTATINENKETTKNQASSGRFLMDL